MSSWLRRLLPVLLLGVLAGVLLPRTEPAARFPAAAAFPAPTEDSRAGSLTFEGVADGDQRAVLAAISRAQPEARRLIEAVAGLTTIRVGDAGEAAAGSTQATPDGYDVMLDLGEVSRWLGDRGIERLVLHELGHVVEFALVPDATLAVLDARIPRGYGCESGLTGACAVPEERFAETFAKWASDDIGVGLSIGYKVPPPAMPLATWAEPLLRLG